MNLKPLTLLLTIIIPPPPQLGFCKELTLYINSKYPLGDCIFKNENIYIC